MNKKRILLALSVLLMLVVLTGCSIPTDESGNVILITSESTWSGAMNEGFFSAALIYPLAQAINFLTPKTGIIMAITLITVAVNVIILALTFRSNVAMQKMQEIQPEIQRIQRKYEGRQDQASQMRMSQEMQAIYQKNHINPLGAMATTFIQLPIIFAVYNAVRRSEAVANAVVAGVTLSITPREAFTEKAWIAVLIWVLMIAFQALSMKVPSWLANRRAKAEADRKHKHWEKPEQQQNFMMTYGMVIFIAFIMLSWPTALSLYYCIFSVITVIKTVVVDVISNKNKNEGK